MISADMTHSIREQIAAAISIKPVANNEFAISMPFIFDDGDECAFRLTKHGRSWAISDGGETVRRASYSGTDVLGAGHAERLRRIVEFYGVDVTDGALSMSVQEPEFSDGIFTFTQVCLEVVNLAKLPKERPASEREKFAEQLARVVTPVVPRERLVADWSDPTDDPDRLYRADFCVKGDTDLLIFGVPSPTACMMATISCQHYKMKHKRFRSLAIYDHEEQIRVRFTSQLNEVVDKRFPRVIERKSIQEYLRHAVA
jgi:hypothetical protein